MSGYGNNDGNYGGNYDGNYGGNNGGNNRGPIFNLLQRLNPGADVEDVFINGIEEAVDTFASFNPNTGLAIFVKENGDILAVDYRRIDALEFN